MKNFLKPLKTSLKPGKAAVSILGLAFDGSHLQGVLLKRSNGSIRVEQSLSVSLALNPATGDPELVGREIRNRLDEAGIRERRCAVGVPLNWALTLQTKLPDLADEDVESFLQIEAERGFPYPFDALLISRSHYRSPAGDRYVTQVAVPRELLFRLEKVLRAARLRPETFSLGILALQNESAGSPNGVMSLTIEDTGVGLLVSSGGGVAILRTLEGAFETEGGEKRLQSEQIAREARITLGQLPSDVRDSLKQLRIFGRNDEAQQLAEELQPRLERMGIRIERVRNYPAGEFGVSLPADTPVSAALSLAARRLVSRATGFEFLPPKTNQWHRFTARYSSRTLRFAGAAAGSIAAVVMLAFLVQEIQLIRLRSKWSAMAQKVQQLDDMQQQIKKYRPWFDDSLRTLSILRRLSEAFPEDGAVSAKTVDIRELGNITCSGTARDSQALLRTLDQLRSANEVTDVKVDVLHGKSPLQFTFNFHWGPGGANEH